MSNPVCVFLSWFKKRREGHTDSHPFRVIKNLQYTCQNESQIERLGFLWRMLQPLSGSGNPNAPLFPNRKMFSLSYCMKRKWFSMFQSDKHSVDGNMTDLQLVANPNPPQWGLTTFFSFFLSLEHLCHINRRNTTNTSRSVSSQ